MGALPCLVIELLRQTILLFALVPTNELEPQTVRYAGYGRVNVCEEVSTLQPHFACDELFLPRVPLTHNFSPYSGRSRPSDKGELSSKSFKPQFCLKIREGGPLSWIRHCYKPHLMEYFLAGYLDPTDLQKETVYGVSDNRKECGKVNRPFQCNYLFVIDHDFFCT